MLGARFALKRFICRVPEDIVWSYGDWNPFGINLTTSHLEPACHLGASASSLWPSEFLGVPFVGLLGRAAEVAPAQCLVLHESMELLSPLPFHLKTREGGRDSKCPFSMCESPESLNEFFERVFSGPLALLLGSKRSSVSRYVIPCGTDPTLQEREPGAALCVSAFWKDSSSTLPYPLPLKIALLWAGNLFCLLWSYEDRNLHPSTT